MALARNYILGYDAILFPASASFSLRSGCQTATLQILRLHELRLKPVSLLRSQVRLEAVFV
jgi:hypothetical protein